MHVSITKIIRNYARLIELILSMIKMKKWIILKVIMKDIVRMKYLIWKICIRLILVLTYVLIILRKLCNHMHILSFAHLIILLIWFLRANRILIWINLLLSLMKLIILVLLHRVLCHLIWAGKHLSRLFMILKSSKKDFRRNLMIKQILV